MPISSRVPPPLAACRGTEGEVQEVVNKARMFEFKPEGEVTTRFAQDGNGMPAPLMQVRPHPRSCWAAPGLAWVLPVDAHRSGCTPCLAIRPAISTHC